MYKYVPFVGSCKYFLRKEVGSVGSMSMSEEEWIPIKELITCLLFEGHKM
jgi:hypothetical protein